MRSKNARSFSGVAVSTLQVLRCTVACLLAALLRTGRTILRPVLCSSANQRMPNIKNGNSS